MKKDIVLHSPDPYLLMRMFTDLQMDGRFYNDMEWNSKEVYKHEIEYLKIYKDCKILFFRKGAGILCINLIPPNRKQLFRNLKNDTGMKKLKVRIIAAYRILFRRYNHWVILDVNDENLVKLLKNESFDADILYHGVQPYIYYKMIKMVGNSKDDIDMLLDKAKFEADASELKN